jgi:FPC/CPF motif-containing protein YcgG
MHPSPATPAAAIHRAIEDHAFPCVGAKAALARDAVQVVEGGDLRRADSDAAVLEAIGRFASTHDHDVVFASLVVAYPRTQRLTEAAFEAALWERLQALHALDRDHAWDLTVSSDPADPAFSMSLGGRAFYIVGLHEGASRPARRIAGAALVFNLHSQFEALRADGRYDKLSEAIRARDIALAGSINPMLSRHGEASEARQYSGRQVGDDWRCPFHPMQEGPR